MGTTEVVLGACPFCGEQVKTAWASFGPTEVVMTPKVWNRRPLEDALQSRIKELEGALMEIRDTHLFRIESNAHEGDKVMCGTGGIRGLLARVIPLYKFPKEALKEKGGGRP